MFAPFKAHQRVTCIMQAGLWISLSPSRRVVSSPSPRQGSDHRLYRRSSRDHMTRLNLIASTLLSMALVNQHRTRSTDNHTTDAMRSRTLQRHPFHPCPRLNNKTIIQRWKGSSVSWSLARPRDSRMIQATHASPLAPSQQHWMCSLLSSDCVLITIAAGTPVHVESTPQLL